MATTLFSTGAKTDTTLQLTLTENGVPVDISGDTIKLFVIDNHVVKKTITADVSTGGASGIALFTITQSDTTLPPNAYRGEIVWYKSNGKIRLIAAGIIEIARRDSLSTEA